MQERTRDIDRPRPQLAPQAVFSEGFTIIEAMVAMSILALGVAGVAQLRHTAYQHLSVSHEIQEASHFADSHLNELNTQHALTIGLQRGEYSRGLDAGGYPWQLSLEPLAENAFEPHSKTLSVNVRPIRADLSVWVNQGQRELRFHSLLLLEPLKGEVFSNDEFNLGTRK